MTDQIPADKVRAILANRGMRASDMIAEIEALLPPPPSPPLPTLADMTPEERDACQWMQCDVAGVRGRWVLVTPSDEDGDAGLVAPYGAICWLLPGRVTPRPDLPRMEWPGDTPTGPGHLAVGAVIESAGDPRIDALPVGSILLDRDEEATMKRPWEWEGEGYIPIPSEGSKFGPWTVLHIPKETDQ